MFIVLLSIIKLNLKVYIYIKILTIIKVVAFFSNKDLDNFSFNIGYFAFFKKK